MREDLRVRGGRARGVLRLESERWLIWTLLRCALCHEQFDEPEALFRISKGKDTRKRYWMRVCDLNDVCMSKVAEYMGQIKKSLSLVAPELKAATDQSLIQVRTSRIVLCGPLLWQLSFMTAN